MWSDGRAKRRQRGAMSAKRGFRWKGPGTGKLERRSSATSRQCATPPLRSAAQDSRHAPRRPAWLQLNADPTGQVETNKTQQEKQAEVCWPFGTRLRPKVWTEEGIRGRAGSHISVIFESVRGTRALLHRGLPPPYRNAHTPLTAALVCRATLPRPPLLLQR